MFDSVDSYYKFHSKIYDFTRWSILFGRNIIFDHLPNLPNEKVNILDVGCGTGKHLEKLSDHYPVASITGLDASKEMLSRAKVKSSSNNKIELINASFEDFLPKENMYDLIFCSYSLSILKDQDLFLKNAIKSLKKNGYLVVVDFDKTPLPIFKKWMKFNHVKISNGLFEQLNKHFQNKFYQTHNSYFGLWKYSFFVGSK
jgi:S-adenosylmethionine-diacylgycerolhomoserine-N-methlytransferase